MPARRWSLRTKLVAACVVVQLAGAGWVSFASQRMLTQTLVDRSQVETRQVVMLLEQAIAAPMAQRDFATLQQSLDLLRSDEFISYIVLRDHRDRVIAAAGWNLAQPLPPRDRGEVDLQRTDTLQHLRVPVMLAGQPLGHAELGLSTRQLRDARADFVRATVLTVTLSVLTAAAAMVWLAMAITRKLVHLGDAASKLAQGDFEFRLPVQSTDEIGRLGRGFNLMAAALRDRVQALQESQQQQAQLLAAVREEQSRLTSLLGAMHSGIVFVGADARVIYVNQAFARMWGLSEVLTGRPLSDALVMLLVQTEAADAHHLDAMFHPGQDRLQRRELRTLDGRLIGLRVESVGAGEPGAAGPELAAAGAIWFFDDLTQEREVQRRARQALQDPLTQLLNRRGFEDAMQSALADAAQQGESVALLYIDLDDFKRANDLGGHQLGDEVLVAVAQTLLAQTRKDGVAARLGGDEFALLCPGLDAEAAAPIAARLVQAVSGLQFRAGEVPVRVGCSVGVASFPRDAHNRQDLLAHADAAMYQAKQSGKNAWSCFGTIVAAA